MKNTTARRGLHLVTAEEAAALHQQPEASPPAESNAFVAAGVQRYRELEEELAREVLGKQDEERMTVLRMEKKILRKCLALYGVRLRA
jgi:hypothetical protein